MARQEGRLAAAVRVVVTAVCAACPATRPSTLGINGFLKINNMGAHLPSVSHEWYVLWAQAACYFVTSCLIYRRSIITSRRRFAVRYNEMKQKMLEKKTWQK